MVLSFLLLMTALFWGFGTSMFTPNLEEQPPVLVAEGLSLASTVNCGNSIRILWTVLQYKVAEGAVWGEEEARKLLFKPLDMDVDKIIFDCQTCRDVVFKKENTNAKEYLDRVYHTTPRALGIEQDVVEVVKTNCDLPGFAEYMRLRDRRLIININGVFFYFEPFVTY